MYRKKTPTSEAPEPDDGVSPGQNNGPITQHMHHQQYLDENKVPEMFQSLIASLMMERPDDMFSYLDTKLEAIKNIGVENIDWETFIYSLHPSRDPVRTQLVQDKDCKENDLPFDAGYGGANSKASTTEEEVQEEEYQPEVFQLTEPLDD